MHPARTFLARLEPRADARFNIETYTDVPKGADKPDPDRLCRRFPNLTHADIEVLLPKLHQLNDHGAGVFIAVNEHNGQRL
jgi:hypothetical protein